MGLQAPWYVSLTIKQDCSTCKLATITCHLIPSDVSQVNVSFILWKPTFIKVSGHIALGSYGIRSLSISSLLVCLCKPQHCRGKNMKLGREVSKNVTHDQLCGAHLPHLSITKLPPESPARCSVLGLCLPQSVHHKRELLLWYWRLCLS